MYGQGESASPLIVSLNLLYFICVVFLRDSIGSVVLVAYSGTSQ